MPFIQITRHVPLPADEAFRRLTTWPRHADFVPLTTIRLLPNGFVARTGMGPFAFDDVMEIVDWRPPHHCRLEKRGRLMQGWAEIGVSEEGEGARVVWKEEIAVRGLPKVFDPLVRLSSERLFGRLIDGLLAT